MKHEQLSFNAFDPVSYNFAKRLHQALEADKNLEFKISITPQKAIESILAFPVSNIKRKTICFYRFEQDELVPEREIVSYIANLDSYQSFKEQAFKRWGRLPHLAALFISENASASEFIKYALKIFFANQHSGVMYFANNQYSFLVKIANFKAPMNPFLEAIKNNQELASFINKKIDEFTNSLTYSDKETNFKLYIPSKINGNSFNKFLDDGHFIIEIDFQRMC